jgi:hypothetical protein
VTTSKPLLRKIHVVELLTTKVCQEEEGKKGWITGRP